MLYNIILRIGSMAHGMNTLNFITHSSSQLFVAQFGLFMPCTMAYIYPNYSKTFLWPRLVYGHVRQQQREARPESL